MESNGNGNGSGLHILMFPFTALGHISPFINLARRLVAADSSLRITFLSSPANVPRIASLFSDSPAGTTESMFTIHSIPLPKVAGLPAGAESTADLDPSQAELLKAAVDAMRPDVQALLSQLRPHFVVFDFAMPWMPSLAASLGIKSLFFTVFAAAANAYLMVPSRCRDSSEVDLQKPPPGFPATSALSAGTTGAVPAYQARDFAYVYKSFGGKPSVYDRFTECMRGCTAIISKTCTEMEGQYIEYIESEYRKPMLLAGPGVPDPPDAAGLEERWAEWLGKFEEGSVIYCGFGSESSRCLKEEGMRELVAGLEMTGMPFLLVLGNGGGGGEARVSRERGVIHEGFVQQQLILGHPSVGCYLNHAGLSSVVEALVAGCRLVMLPLKGDQFLNSALFARDLGIGVEVEREAATGYFTREGVCEAVKKAMTAVETKTIITSNDEDDATAAKREEKRRKWMEFLKDKESERRLTGELVHSLTTLLAT